ncbi:MarR family winged helix-turn-helix transcriptional regulator [Amphibacillus cookii]|uniref:MarR family winged helix-turn-helix transcriptional regulator n=1 Tax=Amphibacillus cookii TaxID=767787 RepID=UPI00195C5292|nr:MarR family transcriptional regulator [Amphibacillus cookii]MBM7542247.1 DNA-binding MarR family transcriptional regulator [Amphibacillus cookii]
MDEDKGKIFASLFLMANRLQMLGDRLDQQLTVKQWLLIAIIYKSLPDQLSVKEIARIVGVTHQNVMQMVKNLKEKGFLEVYTDTKDRRVKRVGLTEKCQQHLLTREDRELEFINRLFADFHTEEVQELSRLIEKLVANIAKMEMVDDEFRSN